LRRGLSIFNALFVVGFKRVLKVFPLLSVAYSILVFPKPTTERAPPPYDNKVPTSGLRLYPLTPARSEFKFLDKLSNLFF
jgi:hypothetical protein